MQKKAACNRTRLKKTEALEGKIVSNVGAFDGWWDGW